jgi:hypothetical protein
MTPEAKVSGQGENATPLSKATPPTSSLGAVLVILSSRWARIGYYIWLGEIWVAVNVASYIVGGPGSLVDIFTADGTFALALVAVLTIQSEQRSRREDLGERAVDRRRSQKLHAKEIEPHLTLGEGHRAVELPRTPGGAPGGTHEDAYMFLRNVGPGIATDLSVEYEATLRPIVSLLPSDADPDDYPPRVDPKRLSPKRLAYLRADDEDWIVWDPDVWERGLHVWESYFDVDDEEIVEVKVRVLCSDIEETPSGGVEATFSLEIPPGGGDDPRAVEYWNATRAGKSLWHLSDGPKRILLAEALSDATGN